MDLTTEEKQAIADRLLGGVKWVRPGIGYCACPGADLHTNTNARRDCRVAVVPGRQTDAPTIYCFHSHCAEVVAEANFKLRSEIGKEKARRFGSANSLNSRLRGGAKSGSNSADRGQSTASKSAASASARTPRTGFAKSVSVAPGGSGQSRTLRTDFLENCLVRAQAHTHEAETRTAEKSSEPSEPVTEEKKTTDPGGSFRMMRAREASSKLCRWVNRDGAVYAARYAERDGERVLEIGRQLAPKMKKVRIG